MTWQRLEVRDLTVSYGSEVALHRLSVSLDRGIVYVVMGSNGSGKSTFLRAISGLVSYVSGRIEPALDPDNWRNEHGVSAILPEDLGSFSDLTARDIVERICRRRATSRMVAAKTIEQSLDELRGLIGYDACEMAQNDMSGGQQRIMSLKIGLMLPPTVVVADEPFAGLDEDLSTWAENQFTTHAEAGGMVVVTHNGAHSSFPGNWRRLELQADQRSGKHVLVGPGA